MKMVDLGALNGDLCGNDMQGKGTVEYVCKTYILYTIYILH